MHFKSVFMSSIRSRIHFFQVIEFIVTKLLTLLSYYFDVYNINIDALSFNSNTNNLEFALYSLISLARD